MLAIAVQPEPEKKSVEQRGTRRAHQQIALKLRPQTLANNETDRRRRHRILPTKLRVDILCARQHEETRERFLRRRRNVRRRPAELLKIARAVSHFDRLVFRDTAEWSHRLDPAAVESRGDAIDLIVRIIAILLRPETSADRIESHAETVSHAVGKNFLDVHGGFAGQP